MTCTKAVASVRAACPCSPGAHRISGSLTAKAASDLAEYLNDAEQFGRVQELEESIAAESRLEQRKIYRRHSNVSTLSSRPPQREQHAQQFFNCPAGLLS